MDTRYVYLRKKPLFISILVIAGCLASLILFAYIRGGTGPFGIADLILLLLVSVIIVSIFAQRNPKLILIPFVLQFVLSVLSYSFSESYFWESSISIIRFLYGDISIFMDLLIILTICVLLCFVFYGKDIKKAKTFLIAAIGLHILIWLWQTVIPIIHGFYINIIDTLMLLPQLLLLLSIREGRVCSKCKRGVSRNSAFCSHCGNAIEQAAEKNTIQKRPMDVRQKIFLAAIWSIAGILLILVPIISMFVSQNAANTDTDNITTSESTFLAPSDNANNGFLAEISEEDILNMMPMLKALSDYSGKNLSNEYIQNKNVWNVLYLIAVNDGSRFNLSTTEVWNDKYGYYDSCVVLPRELAKELATVCFPGLKDLPEPPPRTLETPIGSIIYHSDTDSYTMPLSDGPEVNYALREWNADPQTGEIEVIVDCTTVPDNEIYASYIFTLCENEQDTTGEFPLSIASVVKEPAENTSGILWSSLGGTWRYEDEEMESTLTLTYLDSTSFSMDLEVSLKINQDVWWTCSVEDVVCSIDDENQALKFSFTQDSWGGSGSGTIYFHKNSVASWLEITFSEYNGAGNGELTWADGLTYTKADTYAEQSEQININKSKILPDSDSILYSESEIMSNIQPWINSGYTTAEALRLARNEIFANHGNIFEDESLNNYFYVQRGHLYGDCYQYSEQAYQEFNQTEIANVNTIKQLENQYS